MTNDERESTSELVDSDWGRYASADFESRSVADRLKDHRRVLVGVTAVVVLAALAYWLLRPTTEWVVTAAVDDPNELADACGDLGGIQEQSFSMQSDGAKDPPGGVEWTVEGRTSADAVAACFEQNGAVSVRISESDQAEDKTFDNTGP